MSLRCDRIWRNARLATLSPGLPGLGVIEDGLLAAADGRILFAGAAGEAPDLDAPRVTHCEGRWITPGLIDCHTHLVYGGDRSAEFELRLAGASYEDIARSGGGILSTVAATRAASEENLLASVLPRLDALIAEGVTTVEIKSGYGLSVADELKMLRVARSLGGHRAVTITTTLLAAHAVPPEFARDPEGYVDLICEKIIPTAAARRLADAVDAFCEGIGFSPSQVRRVLDAAVLHDLPVKLHAEQLSNLGGALLAAQFRALSADHLEHLDEAGVIAMARAGTVATLLPGAFYFVRETQAPPVEMLRAHNVPIAIATDSNPGTAPLTSLLLTMNMAATLFRLTVEECLAGVTRQAARALGLGREIGTLEAGKRCDLALWEIERPAELVYRLGFNPLHERVWGGT
ncbi:MAG TPA: imidazolonepropionase [Caulobacteraceae bacterium]